MKSSSVDHLNTTFNDDSSTHTTWPETEQAFLDTVGKVSTFQVVTELYWLLLAGGRKLFYILFFLQHFSRGGESALRLSQHLQSNICPFMFLYLWAAQSPSQQLWKASKYYSPDFNYKETMMKWGARPPSESMLDTGLEQWVGTPWIKSLTQLKIKTN